MRPSASPSTSSPSPIQSLSTWQSTSATRLQALYSDFSRHKTSNPTSFQANVEWWRRALEEFVDSGFQDESSSNTTKSRLVLHANTSLLEKVKVPKVGKPLALGAVLADLHTTSHSIYPLSEFLSLKSSIYATSSLPVRVASYLVGKPLWWALEQMGITGDEGLLSSSSGSHQRHKGTAWHGDYVLVNLVSRAAEAVEERQRSVASGPADRLYSFDGFRKAFSSCVVTGNNQNEVSMSEQDAKVLLKYLERDRGVVVYDKDVIKFVEPDSPAEDRVITPVDRGILELKDAVANMHAQVDSMQEKIDQCTKQASEALKKDRKAHALSYIRSRKQLQELLAKRLSSLATLESTLITVEAAAGDVAIMKSYESSTSTLKAILSHPSLQRENVDKTMEALAEANASAKEIDDAVRMGGDVALGVDEGVDDGEIEKEWEELVRQMGGQKESEGEEQRERLSGDALKVPSGAPQEEGGKSLEKQMAALSV